MGDADPAPRTPPGVSVKRVSDGEQDMGRAEFAVTGMTNGHCESAIRAEMPRVPGFTQVQVSGDGSAGRDRPVGGRGEGGDGRSREGRVRSSRDGLCPASS